MIKIKNDQRVVLLVISGPSGAGKGTLVKKLIHSVSSLNLSVSITTRKPRAKEVNGRDYIFVDEKYFQKGIKKGEFLEWAKVHGDYYGTPYKGVKESFKKGKDLVLEIDVQGAIQVKKKINSAVLIFVMPSSLMELKKRLIKRHTETPDLIKKRMQDAKEEIKYLKHYDYLVYNDNLQDAIQELKAIYLAEKCKVKRRKGA